MSSTDIHDAAEAGDLEKVKMLLKNNADLVSNKDAQGCTPLHMAAMEGRDAVVELLMANKSEINAKNNYGQTPLHMAAHDGHKAVAELLLANGAEVNVNLTSV